MIMRGKDTFLRWLGLVEGFEGNYSRPARGADWSECCSVFREFAIACLSEKALTVFAPSASAAKSNTYARGREQLPWGYVGTIGALIDDYRQT